MNRFTKYLTDMLPRTGRMITERGTTINQADFTASITLVAWEEAVV